MKVTITLYGRPATQGSKRSVAIYRKTKGGGSTPVIKNGRVITRVIEDNPRLGDWRQQVARAALAQWSGPLWTGPLKMTAVFQRPRPKGHFGTGRNAGKLKANAPKYPTGTPDNSKLQRAVEDALTGVLYQDDSQITDHDIRKRWGERFETRIVIEAMEGKRSA